LRDRSIKLASISASWSTSKVSPGIFLQTIYEIWGYFIRKPYTFSREYNRENDAPGCGKYVNGRIP
jgi:hypothetical protein